MTLAPPTALALTDWRRRLAELYAALRAESDPAQAHACWRAGRDELFRTHPQTPLVADDPLRATGLPYWPYDPQWRFELPLRPAGRTEHLSIPTGGDETTELELIGRVELPTAVGGTAVGGALDVWWLTQYGGGLFVPLRDGTAGTTSYGGGRYLLDTAKGADLGAQDGAVVIDLNFLYHPSCRYNPDWLCPLAPPGNTIRAAVEAGERLPRR